MVQDQVDQTTMWLPMMMLVVVVGVLPTTRRLLPMMIQAQVDRTTLWLLPMTIIQDQVDQTTRWSPKMAMTTSRCRKRDAQWHDFEHQRYKCATVTTKGFLRSASVSLGRGSIVHQFLLVVLDTMDSTQRRLIAG